MRNQRRRSGQFFQHGLTPEQVADAHKSTFGVAATESSDTKEEGEGRPFERRRRGPEIARHVNDFLYAKRTKA